MFKCTRGEGLSGGGIAEAEPAATAPIKRDEDIMKEGLLLIVKSDLKIRKIGM